MVAKTSEWGETRKPLQRRFTLDEYDRMVEAGIFCDDNRIELIGGEILRMAAMGSKHVKAIQRLQGRFLDYGIRYDLIRIQFPIRLPPDSEPEPDIAIVRDRPDGYDPGHPNPEDVLLAIEVADTSLAFDRDRKIPRYAAAGILETWLLDLRHRQLMLYRDPEDGVYTSITIIDRRGSATPLAFPELAISVAELLR
ncbi:MAG: Uma2 family endonuclease [Dehalococcoidia bacterium]